MKWGEIYINNGLYLISKPDFVNYDLLNKLCQNNVVKIFQLRLKNINTDSIIEIAKICKLICNKYNVPLIINDSIEVFEKTNADGLHLGLEDYNIQQNIFNITKIKESGKIIGFSCYDNLELAMKYAKSGASYISFGAFFKTKTKKTATRPSQNIILQYNQEVKKLKIECPCCAIGGITNKNISRMVGYGLNYACTINCVLSNESKSLKVAKKINAKFKGH